MDKLEPNRILFRYWEKKYGDIHCNNKQCSIRRNDCYICVAQELGIFSTKLSIQLKEIRKNVRLKLGIRKKYVYKTFTSFRLLRDWILNVLLYTFTNNLIFNVFTNDTFRQNYDLAMLYYKKFTNSEQIMK